MLAAAATSFRRPNSPVPFSRRNISKTCLSRCGVCVLFSRISFPCHAMRVSAPSFGQLVHLLSVNPAATLMHKTMFATLRRRRDPFNAHTVMRSPTSTDSDAKFDVETVPDDRTLVDSRRHSTPPDDDDSIFSDDSLMRSENRVEPPLNRLSESSLNLDVAIISIRVFLSQT